MENGTRAFILEEKGTAVPEFTGRPLHLGAFFGSYGCLPGGRYRWPGGPRSSQSPQGQTIRCPMGRELRIGLAQQDITFGVM